MPVPKSKLIAVDKFLDFCRGQNAIGDHYPHVMLFKKVAEVEGLSLEQSLWLGIVYMAYYDDGSAWCAFTDAGVKDRAVLPNPTYTIAKQRRNLYGGRIVRHFESLAAVPTLSVWLTSCHTWAGLLGALESIYGNGRWASYTTAEMLTDLGLTVRPNSYEIAGSSGPRQGLEYLGLPPTEASATYVHKLVEREGLSVPPQVLESFLCNWSRMNKGGFYVGHNLDRQQGRILKAERLTGRKLTLLWECRKLLFPHAYLGELSGWPGIDKQRLKVYRSTGQVLRPDEKRKNPASR